MIYETIPFPFGGKNNATLTLYCSEMFEKSPIKRRPTVLVIPGGGYSNVSKREGECIAMRFLTMGFHAAVLNYSVKEDAIFPQSLCEAALAMAYLKENCQKYAIDPNRIYTCGFSAGGHLALSLGVFWHEKWLSEKLGKENELLRPTAQIICYPVISADPAFCHSGSLRRIAGKEPTKEQLDLVSLENHITENTPPTFLWTTQPDNIVPCENSLILANALQKAGVPMEFHLYGWGRHGLSLANRITQNESNLDKPLKESQVNPHIATWLPLCQEWLEEMFGVEITKSEE